MASELQAEKRFMTLVKNRSEFVHKNYWDSWPERPGKLSSLTEAARFLSGSKIRPILKGEEDE